MQNRRNFLKMLVGGVAVAAAAPVAEISVSNYLTVADYVDYASFSDFAIAAPVQATA